jgi:predicted aspartyl protease
LKRIGTICVDCNVKNHHDEARAAVVPRVLAGATGVFTWLPSEILQRIGIEPVKKDLLIQMANGQLLTRSVGYAILRVDKYETTDEVVFGQKGDMSLLGSRAMEGMNVHVDARRKRLVAAGPVVAA